MKKQCGFFLGVFLIIVLPFTVFAQGGEPSAILEYFDDPYEIQIKDADGFEVEEIYYGMELLPGDTLVTMNSSAELRLSPNGSIFRLAPGTEFTINSLDGYQQSTSNNFSMVSGKLRSVAAKMVGSKGKYQIETPTTVCGVRGTDFGVQVKKGAEALFVKSGAVEFVKKTTGEAIMLASGQFADAFADTFQPQPIPDDLFNEVFSDLEFQELDPNAVPEVAGDETAETEEEGDGEGEETVEQPQTSEELEGEGEGEEGEDQPTPEEELSGPMKAIYDWLGDYLGMELGSVSINGKTYSKVVFQPEFQFGKFGGALYLPIIYTSDMFDPDDWYHPKGNDEWSFGMDQDWVNEPLLGVQDVLNDVALKIKYLQWGEIRDKFFIKAGNVDDMKIGHGSVMWNYMNNPDFPAIRSLGINTGLDLGGFGFEAVVNDVAYPEIYGGRLYVRPISALPAAIGLTTITDMKPASDLPEDVTEDHTKYQSIQDTIKADPMFLNLALDLDFPIIPKNPIFTGILFADAAGMLPVLNGDELPTSAATNEQLKSGIQWQALWDSENNQLRNMGYLAGLMGNILMIDYRLEYRYTTGVFNNRFYNNNYMINRGEYAINTIEYLQDPTKDTYQSQKMGIYGDAGFTFIKEKIVFKGGYFWPWDITEDGTIAFGDTDEIALSLVLKEGLLPFAEGAKGSIAYYKTKLIPPLVQGEEFHLFDANTIFEGTASYPVSEVLDIIATISTSVQRDENGNIVYDEETGDPLWAPSVTIETSIDF